MGSYCAVLFCNNSVTVLWQYCENNWQCDTFVTICEHFWNILWHFCENLNTNTLFSGTIWIGKIWSCKWAWYRTKLSQVMDLAQCSHEYLNTSASDLWHLLLIIYLHLKRCLFIRSAICLLAKTSVCHARNSWLSRWVTFRERADTVGKSGIGIYTVGCKFVFPIAQWRQAGTISLMLAWFCSLTFILLLTDIEQYQH